ncbi:rhodanese-like domain-containing protein [Thiorhodococcus mannitoliphagus]|uniref:Rhodanese-like domain-containing protein n=1 Tax=Thiorhodococcus mannitoliphagus TaxID=329406 RepID=A0A6P1DW03_9GAMM|nr:rhodanese-like domain-containing protein [Thiorhodococcus mannitoliphagus]NEX20876.1 rhodanese-like domain-containing protein [Thiorhodococcus mannitoliphagus]
MLYKRLRWLTLLLVALLLTVGCSEAAGPNLSAEDALAKAQAGEITLIDIRTPGEWRQTGIATVAKRVDMADPKGPSAFLSKLLKEMGGDKSAPIALICRTGNRSTYLQEQLQSIGFTNVYNVPEGMAGSKAGPGWIRSGLPMKPCSDC